MKRSAVWKYLAILGPFLGLLFIYLFFCALDLAQAGSLDRFGTLFTAGNLKTVAAQTTIVALAALGMTLVIISAGIDLSPGSSIALTTVVVALTLKDLSGGPFLAVVLGIATGSIVGFLNGVMITGLRIVPFIVTLGMMGIARGVAKFLAGNTTVQTVPETWLKGLLAIDRSPEAPFWNLPWGVVVLAFFAALVFLILRFSVFGRHVFAIGSNESTARLCGIRVGPTKVLIYTLAGALTGVAGILQFSRLAIGDPTGAVGIELNVIASVVIGGASLNGGKGGVAGTMIGALIMGVLKNACDIYGIPNYVQEIFIGLIIIAAVGLDQIRKRWDLHSFRIGGTQRNMSSFQVLVRRIEVFPHPNADLLELAKVDDYRCVVKKGELQTGDLVAYIPEASLVPAELLEEMKLTGRLAGSEKNRVKAVKLRGELSQGLVLKARPHWKEGDEVAQELGITKWSPPIPIHLAGELERSPPGWHGYTEIENLKRFPDVLTPGEEVVITEKVHGTCTLLGLLGGQRAMSSKGHGAGHKVIKNDGKNLYWKVAGRYQLFERLEGLGDVMLFGETFGAGVQDLQYGVPRDEPSYLAFDLSIGGRYLDYDDFLELCALRGIPTVPSLYRGPFGPECLALTAGKETISGKGLHVREGIVIRPTKGRHDPTLGRVILKSISAEYLLRGGEATEYE